MLRPLSHHFGEKGPTREPYSVHFALGGPDLAP